MGKEDQILEKLDTLIAENLELKNEVQELKGKYEQPVTVDQIAELTGFSKQYIYNILRAGGKVADAPLFPFHRKGSRYFFFRHEVIKWLKSI